MYSAAAGIVRVKRAVSYWPSGQLQCRVGPGANRPIRVGTAKVSKAAESNSRVFVVSGAVMFEVPPGLAPLQVPRLNHESLPRMRKLIRGIFILAILKNALAMDPEANSTCHRSSQ